MKEDWLCSHPLWNTYKSMIDRCYRKTHNRFENYGGRGINVCERWLPDKTKKYGTEGFLNFIADMGEKPVGDYSINRVDNDGNYEPDNCVWSTRSEQQRNKNPYKQPNNTGSKNKSSKLTENQVAQIKRLLLEAEYTQMEIASMYGVSQVAISLIKRGKKWIHVEPEKLN